jgi:hypothetical protein
VHSDVGAQQLGATAQEAGADAPLGWRRSRNLYGAAAQGIAVLYRDSAEKRERIAPPAVTAP